MSFNTMNFSFTTLINKVKIDLIKTLKPCNGYITAFVFVRGNILTSEKIASVGYKQKKWCVCVSNQIRLRVSAFVLPSLRNHAEEFNVKKSTGIFRNKNLIRCYKIIEFNCIFMFRTL